MEQYSEEEEQGGKKLLVILLILLLCLVSMFGAGYVVAEKIDGGGSGGEGYIHIDYGGAGPIFDYTGEPVVMFTSDSEWSEVAPDKWENVSSVKANAYGTHADKLSNGILAGTAPVVYKESGAVLKSVTVSVSANGNPEDLALVNDIVSGFTVGGEAVPIDGSEVCLDISDVKFDDGVYEKSYDVYVYFNKNTLKTSDIPALTHALKNVTFTVTFEACGE